MACTSTASVSSLRFAASVLFAFVLVSCTAVHAQNVQFAGAESVLPVSGPSSTSPVAIAVDASGNVYISDMANGQVVRETPSASGYAQTVVTTGLSSPRGIAVDASGNVYIADYGGNQLYIVKCLGTGYGSATGLLTSATTTKAYSPVDVAVDQTGNVYFTSWGDTHVWELPLVGHSYRTATSLAKVTGLTQPNGLAFDLNGDLFIVDYSGTNQVSKLAWTGSAWGTFSTVPTSGLPAGPFKNPARIAVDGKGNLYVADTVDNQIVKVPWLSATTWDTPVPVTTGALNDPEGVAVDANKNVYIADRGNNRALKETLSGVNFGTVAVGTQSTAATLFFNFNSTAPITLGPTAVVTQGAAGLDFADAGTGTCAVATPYSANSTCTVNATFTPQYSGTRNGAVLLEDGSGKILATAYIFGTGSGPQVNFPPGTESTAGSGFIPSLGQPLGVAVDAKGNVYIADYLNNNVWKAPATGSASTVGTGLSYPSGVAVDGAGNVFIADYGNGKVKEVPRTGSSYGTQISLSSSATQPTGVAVDGSGNIYIADYGQNKVYKQTPSAGSYSETTVPTTGLSNPYLVAADAFGNVYIADSGNGRVVEVPWSGSAFGTQITIVDSLASPSGVAIDGNGNLYISATGNSQVLKATLSGVGYILTPVQTGALSSPYGLAVDGAGNLFVADFGHGKVLKEDYADAPSVNFTVSTAVGLTSADSPQLVMVENVGNAALKFPVLTTGNNPSIPAGFTLDSGVPSACTILTSSSGNPEWLAAGDDCQLSISFSPVAAGQISGSVVLTDNSLNVNYATQTLPLSGTATQSTRLIPTTVSASCSTAAYSYGNTYQCSVYMSSSNGTPTGSINYSLDGGTVYSPVLTGNTASFTIPQAQLSAGSHSVVIGYSAQGNFAAAKSITERFIFAQAQVGVTLKVSPSTSSVKAGTNVTFTATVSTNSLNAPAPTGTVNFYDGAGLVASQPISSGVATYSTTSLAVGSHTVTAVYPGDTARNYASGQASQNITVTGTNQTITFTGLPASATYLAAGPYALNATATSGLPVTLTVTSGPAVLGSNSNTCTAPCTLTISGAGTVVVTAYQAGGTSGTGTYGPAAPVKQTIVVKQATQLITFSAPTSVTYSGQTITLSASASSGLPVAISLSSGPATLVGNALTITGVGKVVVSANQPGNTNYSAASQVQKTILVNIASQTIALNGLPSSAGWGGTPISFTATGGNSGNPVTLSVSGPAKLSGVATSGATTSAFLTITAAGTVVVTANQAGNSNYLAAPPASTSISVTAQAQTITWPAFFTPPVVYSSGLSFTLNAKATSGLPVSYTATGPATLNGSKLTVTGAGTVVVNATQAGNSKYLAASNNPVTQTMNVGQGSQTINFVALPTSAAYSSGLNFVLSATATSGLPVTFSVVSGPAKVSGSTLTITSAGTVVVRASQAGNANYLAAAPQDQTIAVGGVVGNMGISCGSATFAYGGNFPCTVTMSSNAGTPKGSISYTLDPPGTAVPVTITSGSASFTITKPPITPSPHSVLVTYIPLTGSNFTAPAAQTETFTVTPAPVTVQLGASTNSPKAGASITFNVSISSNAGAPSTGSVTFTDSASSSTFTGVPVSFSNGQASCTLPGGLTAGSHTITATYSSGGGNYASGSASQTITVGATSQTITFTGLPSAANLTALPTAFPLTATTTASGLTVTLNLAGTAGSFSSTTTVTSCTAPSCTLYISGPGTVTVTASQPGNSSYSAAASVSKTIVVSPAKTTTALTSSPAPQQGEPGTLTATISGEVGTTFTSDTVAFSSGGASIGCDSIAVVAGGGVLTAKCSYTPTLAGTVSVKATFVGDTNNQASTGNLSLSIGGATPVTLSLSSTSLVYPGVASLTACAVSGKKTAATGTVNIEDGSTKLTTLTLGSNGCATWSISPGLDAVHSPHILTAVYSGDSNNAGGTSSTQAVTVTGAPVTMNASCANPTFALGGSYQCSVSVYANGGTPTGNVTYAVTPPSVVGSANSAVLNSGTAQFSITPTAVTTYTVTVNYAAQGNYAAATQQTEQFIVTGASVTVQLTPSTYYAQAGTNVSFAANVASYSAGAPTPTGSVTFTDSVPSLPGTTTFTLVSGTATYATTKLSAGSHTITATYTGNGNYTSDSGSASQTITVAANSQTITFTGLPSTASYSTGLAYPLTATASSGLSVSYSVIGPANFASGTTCDSTLATCILSITGAGQVTVTATQAGDSSKGYSAAQPVSANITINQGTQKITFAAPASPVLYSSGLQIPLVASSNSGLPVTVTAGSGPGTVSGSNLLVTGAGTIYLTATQAGNANFQAASQVQRSIVVNPGTQPITLAAFSPATVPFQANLTYQLAPTGGASGNPVTLSVQGPASLNGGLLTITGAGTVTVTANQAGNSNYAAAQPVQQSLVVTQGSQTIGAIGGFSSGTSAYSSGLTYTLSASATSGLPVAFSVSGPASLSGTSLSITGSGTVVVTATQAGNANYAAATPVQVSHTYTGGIAQTIAFSPSIPSTMSYGGTPISLSATGGGSGNPVTFSVSSGPGVINYGNQFTPTGVGPVIISADQAGNTTYTAAATQHLTITVNQGSQTINFSAPSSPVTFGSASPILLSPSASSGLPVTLGVTSGLATLSNNTLTYTGAGAVVVTATQAGNANYLTATAVARTITVNPAPVSMAVSCWNSTFVYGGAYNCSVTMTASAAAGAPNGSVNYSLDLGTASSASLTGGATTFQIPYTAATAKSHSLVITYAPSSSPANFATTSSQTENFTVTPAPVNVTLTPSATSASTSGGSITFTAGVTLQSATGAPTPTGSVTFLDGNLSLATVPITVSGTTGIAAYAYATNGLSVGVHTITANYTGLNYNPGLMSTVINITQ